jgi:uncharacterized protein (TIGR02145 family)
LSDSCEGTFLANNANVAGLALSVRCLKDEKNVTEEILSSSSSSSRAEYSSLSNTLKDSRDGKIYKTVQIGSQTWMAENLAYEYKMDGITYGNYTVDSHKEYGYYYTWAVAMDSAGVFSANGMGCGYETICEPTYPVRGICPEGWHLPDPTEWKTLYSALNEDWAAMQAVGYDGWPDATNASGFSALPAGHCDGDSWVRDDDGDYYAEFWSATEYYNSRAPEYRRSHARVLRMIASGAYITYSHKPEGYSVRCLKD